MKQSNALAGFIVVIVITIVAYVGFFKIDWDKESDGSDNTLASAGSTRDIFSYVPAETLFFFGGLTAAPFLETINLMAPNAWMTEVGWELSEEERTQLPPAAIMTTSIMTKYMKLLKNPETAAEKLGVGKKVDAVVYTVGFIPVLRLQLADTAAFNQFIDEVEQYAKIKPTITDAGDMKIRAYSFDMADDKKPTGAKFIIGSNSQYAVLSLATKVESSEARDLIVGTTKPATALNAATTLGNIKDKYGYNPAYIGYVNHKEIMKGLTGEGSGEFEQMLDAVINMAKKSTADESTSPTKGDDATKTATNPATKPSTRPDSANNENPLAAIRNDACRKELMAITESWPQTVFGYTKIDFKNSPKAMDASMVIEGTDAAFMKEMQAIRGFIPELIRNVSQQPLFGFGLGINIDGISPFVAKATQGFISKEYQCDFLAQIKQTLTQSNPAMAIGMMSGMAAGLQGASITILDVDGDISAAQQGAIPDIKSIDAILTISSSNPQQLLMMAANLQPGMPPIQLPPDGTPIDAPIPLPLPAGSQLKLALKGNHIVAYIGEKAAKLADKLTHEKLQPNGLFAFNINFGKYMSLLAKAATSATATKDSPDTALSQKDKAMLNAMTTMNMQLVESLDIAQNGITFDVKMEME